MKITNIETFLVDGGWRPWIFVKDDYMTIPKAPGWGADLDEEEMGKHPWTG